MAKNDKAAAQRAKKKHQKDKKRKLEVVKKRRTEAERLAVEAEVRSMHRAREDVLRDWKPEQEGVHGLAMRSQRNLFETARSLEHLAHHGTALPDYLWTTSRIAALSTEDIVAKLAPIGIETSQAGFAEGSKQDISALGYWERAWEPGLADTTPVRDLDFAALAACELWQRWQPERPSSEMMLARLIDADEAEHHEDYALAGEKALEMWSFLRTTLPGKRTVDQIQERLHVDWDFMSWTDQLFEYGDKTRETRPELGARIAEAFEQMLAEVTDADEDERLEWIDFRAKLTAPAGSVPAVAGT